MIRLKPKANWKQFNHPLGGSWYVWGYVRAHVSQDGPEKLWHLSVSCEHRYPTWDEIFTAWYDLVPDAAEIEGAILLPRKSEYVNLHPNCFHIHQLRDSEMPVGILR
jgi:hypothetical protein